MNHDKKFAFGGKGLTRCLLTAAILSVFVCGSLIFTDQPVWAAKKSVIVGMTQEPVNFNPLLYVNSGTEEVPEACMFDALWDINEKGEFIPNLAVKVPTLENGGISQDGNVWKIEKRAGGYNHAPYQRYCALLKDGGEELKHITRATFAKQRGPLSRWWFTKLLNKAWIWRRSSMICCNAFATATRWYAVRSK